MRADSGGRWVRLCEVGNDELWDGIMPKADEESWGEELDIWGGQTIEVTDM